MTSSWCDQRSAWLKKNGHTQAISIFRRDDIPVSLGLLIDNSGSMLALRSRVEAGAMAESYVGAGTRDRKDNASLATLAVDVARQIRSQYTIAYTPQNQTLDDSYREIKVTVAAPDHLSVHTRDRYRASKYF